MNPSAVRRLRSLASGGGSAPPARRSSSPSSTSKGLTTLQEANPRNLPELWFTPTLPDSKAPGFDSWRPPSDQDRNVKLGKTLRILQERLPTLLQSPLPQEILAPNISLHLFPSTHPHLPTVSGRVAYIAALWSAPIVWNRVPIVGNVKLEILSERMVKQPMNFTPRRQGACGEQLVVRWKTIGKNRGWGLTFSNGQSPSEDKKEFTGLFIFEFDKEGRILSHTIEHVQEGGDWERGVGAKVVGLTDWLLGGMKGGREGGDTPCPAFHIPGSQSRRGR